MINGAIGKLISAMNNPTHQLLQGWELPLRQLIKAALGVTIFCLFNPLIPVFPSNIPLDPSWVLGLNQAVSQKIPFGEGLVFTFGPYAAIYTKAYHPATNHLEILGSLYLSAVYFLALLKTIKKASIVTLIGLGIIFAGFITHLDALFYSYALLVSIYSWRLLNAQHNLPRKNYWKNLITIALLFSAFGLYPLIKGPHFVVFIPIAFITMIAFAYQRQWLEMLVIPASISISMIGFWIYSGQSPSNLIDYFEGLVILIAGFSQAMSMNGNTREVIGFVIAATLIIYLILRRGGVNIRTLYICCAFLLFLLAILKAGFVRHDGHALMSSSGLAIAALLLFSIFPSRHNFWVGIFICVAFFNIEIQYKPQFIHQIYQRIHLTYQSTWQGIGQRLFQPEKIHEQFHQALTSLARLQPLPVFSGSTDIYPFDQSYLIASGNQWNPRPIFQSYHAYSKKLSDKNNQHLNSKDAPDYLFFRIESIDDRLPSGDDGASWPSLLRLYQPNGFSGPYLILKKKISAPDQASATSIFSQTLSLNQWVDIPDRSEKIFATIKLEQTWIGKVKNLFYKSSTLVIHLRLQDGSLKQYRLIAGNAESIFLLSPLIENAQEFKFLYQDINALQSRHVSALSISTQGSERDWHSSYQLNLQAFK